MKFPIKYKKAFVPDPEELYAPRYQFDSRGRLVMPLTPYQKLILFTKPGSKDIGQSTEDAAGEPQTDPGSLKTGYLHAETAIKVGPEGGWVTQIAGGDYEYPLSYFNETTQVMNFYVDKAGNVYLKGKLIAGADSEVDWSYIDNIAVKNIHIAEVLTVGNTEADVTADSDFVNVTYPADQTDLQTQIDGKIVSWFTDTDPSLTWEGSDESHTGDMWWNTSTKKLKRYTGSAWSAEIEDQKAIDAYANAATAQDTADGKRRVFIAQPTTPYNVGDLWVEGSSGDIKKCKVERLTEAYQAGDWDLASKYDKTSEIVGAMAYENLVELAKLGSTIVDGGYLKTILIDAEYIKAGIMTGRTVQTAFPTGTNKVIRLSSVNTHLMEFMYGADVIGKLEVLYNVANDLAGFTLDGGGGAYIMGSGKANMGTILIGLSNKYLGLAWEGNDPATERIVTIAEIDSSWIPYTSGYDLGSVTKKWQHLYLSGTAFLDGKLKIPVGTNLYA